MGLTCTDVDLSRGSLLFRQTKNGEDRVVPLVGEALDLLRMRPQGGGKVFPHDIRKAWETARRRADLENFRWHDLRHDCASRMAASGASLLDIQFVLGHKTPAMSLRYTHMNDQRMRDVLSRTFNNDEESSNGNA